jgi:hypothetical protein
VVSLNHKEHIVIPDKADPFARRARKAAGLEIRWPSCRRKKSGGMPGLFNLITKDGRRSSI